MKARHITIARRLATLFVDAGALGPTSPRRRPRPLVPALTNLWRERRTAAVFVCCALRSNPQTLALGIPGSIWLDSTPGLAARSRASVGSPHHDQVGVRARNACAQN